MNICTNLHHFCCKFTVFQWQTFKNMEVDLLTSWCDVKHLSILTECKLTDANWCWYAHFTDCNKLHLGWQRKSFVYFEEYRLSNRLNNRLCNNLNWELQRIEPTCLNADDVDQRISYDFNSDLHHLSITFLCTKTVAAVK